MTFSDDGPVLVMCKCEHPRHGHAIRKRRAGRWSMGGETWTVRERSYCTMKLPDGSPCPCNHFQADDPPPESAGSKWRPIATAPKFDPNQRWVEVWNGKAITAHWAQDLSGEEQPPFSGWYCDDGSGRDARYMEVVPAPTHWRPIP